jgi:hypothetical protein
MSKGNRVKGQTTIYKTLQQKTKDRAPPTHWKRSELGFSGRVSSTVPASLVAPVMLFKIHPRLHSNTPRQDNRPRLHWVKYMVPV